MTDYFILDERGEPVPATYDEWREYMTSLKLLRVVARTDAGDFQVVTMFFGQPERVWEMRVGKYVPHDIELITTARGSREQAEAMHMAGIAFVLKKYGFPPIPYELVFPDK